MKQFILASALAVACATATAAAPVSNDLYAGFGVGPSQQDISVNGYSDSNELTAYNFNGGYKFNPNFALEIGYAGFSKNSGGDANVSASIEPNSYYAAAVGIYPVSQAFSIYGKLGVARSRTRISARLFTQTFATTQSETTLAAGFGVSYAVAPNIDLTLEYLNLGKVVKEDGFDVKAAQLTVGARFSF